MWYPTVTETQQTMPPAEAKAEQQSDALVDQAVAAIDTPKPTEATTPGSEYWLP